MLVQGLILLLRRVAGLPSSGSNRGKALRLMAVYRSIDGKTSRFREQTGLSCADGCGRCCLSPGVEATELELLPLAVELDGKGILEAWYRKAEARGFLGRCVFFTGSGDDHRGDCAVYPYRPLICRLFGYSGNRDKHGRPRLVGCAGFREQIPERLDRAHDDVAAGQVSLPLMDEQVTRVSSVDPALSRESLPINTAFKRAAERVWLDRLKTDTRKG